MVSTGALGPTTTHTGREGTLTAAGSPYSRAGQEGASPGDPWMCFL